MHEKNINFFSFQCFTNYSQHNNSNFFEYMYIFLTYFLLVIGRTGQRGPLVVAWWDDTYRSHARTFNVHKLSMHTRRSALGYLGGTCTYPTDCGPPLELWLLSVGQSPAMRHRLDTHRTAIRLNTFLENNLNYCLSAQWMRALNDFKIVIL